MKIAFVISSMESGGAERVVATLANHWVLHHTHSVEIFTFEKHAYSFYKLQDSIKIHPLDLLWPSSTLRESITSNLRRLRILRAAICNAAPDIVLSFIDTVNVRVILSLMGSGIPLVVSERSDPWLHSIGTGFRCLRKLTYPFAHRIAVQGSWAKSFFPRWLFHKIDIIPNPVPKPEVQGPLPKLPSPLIMSIGRHSREKGHDLLIEAFAKAARERPHWHLALVGDGPLHQLLREQTRRLGLEERIHFPGRIQNVPEYLARADLFVLPSLYEGFPNALCEAMASGMPVIATDCGSVADIITDRQNGLLVPPNSIDSLAAALSLLMDNPDLRLKLGVKAEGVVERFSINAVTETWDRTLQRAIQATQRKR